LDVGVDAAAALVSPITIPALTPIAPATAVADAVAKPASPTMIHLILSAMAGVAAKA
jgi:hypothetical protein